MVLDLLGTRAFLPALCAQLQKASAQPIPLDPVILQSILLVLAIGHRKNLILRAVDPEEVAIIARIAEWILSTVFNRSTHRLKIRPSKPSKSKAPDDGVTNPTTFLRSLFLVPVPSMVETFQSNKMLSTTLWSMQGAASHDKAQTDPFADSRRASELSITQLHAHHSTNPGHIVTSFSSSSHLQHHNNKRFSRSSSHHMPKSKSTLATSATLHIPSALVITGLEDASDVSQRALVRVLANGRLELPKHDGQIGALDETSETECWDLPEEFMIIYITYWEPRTRPDIRKSLLDKFAMSTNITVTSKVKRALRPLSTGSSIGARAQNPFASQPNSPHLLSHSVHSTPRSVSGSLPHHVARADSQTPQQRPIPVRTPSTITSSAAANIFSASPQRPASSASQEVTPLTLPTDFLSQLRHATMHRTQLSPSLNLYLQDLFSAARFDSPELDATLLTAKATEDAEMLIRACRVLGTELGGWELARSSVSDSIARTNEIEEDQGDSSNTNGHAWEFEAGYDHSGSIAIDIGIEDTNSERGSVDIQEHIKDMSAESRTPHFNFNKLDDVTEGANSGGDLFDVSEAYVARIVPRVISHRVKMRESWRDEVLAGAVCGAVFSVEQEHQKIDQSKDSQDGLGRSQRTSQVEGDLTVKDMLVRILQRV